MIQKLKDFNQCMFTHYNFFFPNHYVLKGKVFNSTFVQVIYIYISLTNDRDLKFCLYPRWPSHSFLSRASFAASRLRSSLCSIDLSPRTLFSLSLARAASRSPSSPYSIDLSPRTLFSLLHQCGSHCEGYQRRPALVVHQKPQLRYLQVQFSIQFFIWVCWFWRFGFGNLWVLIIMLNLSSNLRLIWYCFCACFWSFVCGYFDLGVFMLRNFVGFDASSIRWRNWIGWNLEKLGF